MSTIERGTLIKKNGRKDLCLTLFDCSLERFYSALVKNQNDRVPSARVRNFLIPRPNYSVATGVLAKLS